MALLRPQLETLVRGAWYQTCATDKQLDRYWKGDEPPNLGLLIKQLEDFEPYTNKQLSPIKKEWWPHLNALTHGGADLIKLSFSSVLHQDDFKKLLAPGLLNIAAAAEKVCALGILSISCDQPSAEKLSSSYRQIYPLADDVLEAANLS